MIRIERILEINGLPELIDDFLYPSDRSRLECSSRFCCRKMTEMSQKDSKRLAKIALETAAITASIVGCSGREVISMTEGLRPLLTRRYRSFEREKLLVALENALSPDRASSEGALVMQIVMFRSVIPAEYLERFAEGEDELEMRRVDPDSSSSCIEKTLSLIGRCALL